MHQEKDKAALKQAVLDVNDLVRRLPALAPEIKEDLRFAYELVMAKSGRFPNQRSMPTLSTEDL